MPLQPDVESHLARVFGEARTLAVDPDPEDVNAPWVGVAVAPGIRTDGALVIASDARDLGLRIERAAQCVPPGRSLVVLHPSGAGGVRGAMRRLLASKAPVCLEDACEALLQSRLASVRAEAVGRGGWLAWGRVRGVES
ncbi:MAG: hypothetical protein AB8I08_24375 [Sandaracinaceae bacterium]